MTMEVWKSIPGFSNYEASNRGCIRSVRRWEADLKRKDGRHGRQHYGGTILKPTIKKSIGHRFGYAYVSLRGNDKYAKRYVHRLVLLAFIGTPPDGMHACHNDGDSLNNNIENLRWDTPSANQLDRKRHGTAFNPSIKLNEEKVRYIRNYPDKSSRAVKIHMKLFNVGPTTIYNILNGKTWQQIR